MKEEHWVNNYLKLSNIYTSKSFNASKGYLQFDFSVTHALSIFIPDNCWKYLILLKKDCKKYPNNLILLKVIKEPFLSKITNPTYFDTKITVNKHVCTTPISAILDKSLFKS